MTDKDKGQRPPSLLDVLGEDADQYFDPPEPEGPNATEGAEKLALELKLDLKDVKGTGKNGRIKESDVRYHEQRIKNAEAAEKRKAEQAEAEKKRDRPWDGDEAPEGITIRYAGHTIEIQNRKADLEDMRAIAEEHYPELGKDRTNMIYDAEKNILVPVVAGHRKGASRLGFRDRVAGITQPYPVFAQVPADHETRPVYYIMGEDGVWQVRRTQAGIFTAKVKPKHGLALADDFRLSVPKIPMREMVQAMGVWRDNPDKEIMLNFVFDRSIGRYGLVFPRQKGTAGSVLADGTMETDDRFIVLQMHSHPGSLGAFFSSTDDADEVRTGLYGVVGHVTDIPEFRFRFSCGGTFVEVDPEAIFTDWDPWALDPVEG